MIPYWLIFVLWAGGAVQAERRGARDALFLFFLVASVATALFVGLRLYVGGDWDSYQRMYESIYPLSFKAALGITDPAYAALNWLAARLGFGVIFANFVCAALFMAGLSRLAWRQPNPALAMLVAVPYLIIVVAMGYTRQSAAIGFVCFAIADASEHRFAKILILIGIAALFHKTAVLVLPLLLVPILRKNVIYGAIGSLAFVILFILVLRDNSDRLVGSYVQGNYDSQGATIRVAMNVIAAAIFIALRDKTIIPTFQKSYWTTCAILSFLSVPALTLASASAGIDRISLYLIPLQIVIYAQIPYNLSEHGKPLPSILIGVIAYCFLVQFIWLNYAANAEYWLPYSIAI